MKTKIFLNSIFLVLLIFMSSCKKDEIESAKDIDGNVYKAVKIGDQIWMAENLKVTHYRNGDPIEGKVPYRNQEKNIDIYGYLYTWSSVDNQRGLAPVGWRIPTKADFEILLGYFNDAIEAANKLSSTTHWWAPNTDATNETGFTALPGGYIENSFAGEGQFGKWWSYTVYNNYELAAYSFKINISAATISNDLKKSKLSVRCIKE